MAKIVDDFTTCVHVTEYNATSVRSAAARCVALARRHYGGPVMTVSSGAHIHDGQIDYTYVLVPRPTEPAPEKRPEE